MKTTLDHRHYHKKGSFYEDPHTSLEGANPFSTTCIVWLVCAAVTQARGLLQHTTSTTEELPHHFLSDWSNCFDGVISLSQWMVGPENGRFIMDLWDSHIYSVDKQENGSWGYGREGITRGNIYYIVVQVRKRGLTFMDPRLAIPSCSIFIPDRPL